MNKSLTNNQNLTVAIEIGTTKVCAIAAVRDEFNKLKIVGFGKVDSEGVLRGVVKNIDKTISAIKEAVRLAEEQAGRKFTTINVCIAGQYIRSFQHRGILTRDNPNTVITEADIQKLISDMGKLVLPAGDKIVNVLPQEYTVDNENGISDPLGMPGVRLEANFHIITTQEVTSNNLKRCIENAGLKVGEMILGPIASAEAVLSDEEKDAGIALVDIGGGTTDIAIIKDGIVRHVAVIPIGANTVTSDIKEGCMVLPMQAEKLKVKHGSALAEEVRENKIITIEGIRGHEPREVSKINLARIIQARMEEILDFISYEIRRSGFDGKLIGGMVLTGGGSMLNHLKKLAAYRTGMSVRIGSPREFLSQGYLEEFSHPMYATTIGLLLNGIPDLTPVLDEVMVEDLQPAEEAGNDITSTIPYQDDPNDPEIFKGTKKQSSWIENLFDKTKGWFTDTDE